MFKIPPKFFIAFVIILAFFALRLHTFYLAHNTGDEVIYLNLAYKFERAGLGVFKSDYNVYYADIKKIGSLYSIIPTQKKFGTMAGAVCVSEGSGLETAELSHHPPLLGYLLMLSHKLFGTQKEYLAAWSNLTLAETPAQFYACIVPLLASFLLTILVFYLGQELFSPSIGALAALLMAFAPIDILTSQKIWADDLVALLALLAVILYLKSLKKNNLFFSGLAGVCVGLAFLAKQSGLLFLAVIAMIHCVVYPKDAHSLFKKLLDKKIAYFMFSFFVVIAPWLFLSIKEFGILELLMQFEPVTVKLAAYPTDFIKFVNTRPWYTYLVNFPFQQPFLILSYFSWFYLFRDKLNRKKLAMLIAWTALFLAVVTFRRDKELRYILGAYPAITILSAYVFFQIKNSFKVYRGYQYRLAMAVLFIFTAISFLLSAKIGLTFLFLRASLIPIPV